MNVAQGAAVCGIPISPTETCGVQAIGRCATCKRAFCTSHQAHESNRLFSRADMCAPCFAQTPAEVRRVRKARDKSDMLAAMRYLTYGGALTALLTAGVPPVELYEIKQAVKRGFWKDSLVEVATPIGRGWILGEFKWQFSYPQGFPNGDLKRYELKDCLTALWDNPGYNRPVAVYPNSGGYACHSNSSDVTQDSWIPLMEAVKRLAGESS